MSEWDSFVGADVCASPAGHPILNPEGAHG